MPKQVHRQAIRLMVVALALVLMVMGTASPASAGGRPVNVLANGSFELAFAEQPGCGDVGARWGCFTNGGAANFGFYADQWTPVVADGQSSQLIEINTYGIENGDNDRYAGIYQTVRVIPGETYMLSMRGMIRTTNLDGDPWRYQVQVGYVAGPQVDWRKVRNWTDTNWNTYYPRTEPGAFSDYQAAIIPDSPVITLFIRVWKKWGIGNEELDVNLDAITLVGPTPK